MRGIFSFGLSLPQCSPSFEVVVSIYRASSRPWMCGATLTYDVLVSLYYFCSSALAEYFYWNLGSCIISYPKQAFVSPCHL